MYEHFVAIFEFMSYYDVIQVRRVCKEIKNIADRLLNSQSWRTNIRLFPYKYAVLTTVPDELLQAYIDNRKVHDRVIFAAVQTTGMPIHNYGCRIPFTTLFGRVFMIIAANYMKLYKGGQCLLSSDYFHYAGSLNGTYHYLGLSIINKVPNEEKSSEIFRDFVCWINFNASCGQK